MLSRSAQNERLDRMRSYLCFVWAPSGKNKTPPPIWAREYNLKHSCHHKFNFQRAKKEVIIGKCIISGISLANKPKSCYSKKTRYFGITKIPKTYKTPLSCNHIVTSHASFFLPSQRYSVKWRVPNFLPCCKHITLYGEGPTYRLFHLENSSGN